MTGTPSSESAPRSDRTLDKIRLGGLPPQLATGLRVGSGSGRKCNGCDEHIGTSEREFGVDYSRTLTFRFHVECYEAWSTRTDSSY